jgi:hypothetical protein
MCAAWNSPGYQELERLVALLAAEVRPLYRAVVAMYVYPRFVRRAVCPRCGHVTSPAAVGELHRDGHRKSTAYVARMVWVPLYPIEERRLSDAVAWLRTAGTASRSFPTSSCLW